MRLLKQMLRVSEGATYSQAGAVAVSFSIRWRGDRGAGIVVDLDGGNNKYGNE